MSFRVLLDMTPPAIAARARMAVIGAAAFAAACAGGAPALGGADGTSRIGATRGAPAPGAPTYHVYVANESADVVSEVAFTPGADARIAGETEVGIMPADLDGPHGITASPDGRYWYVSLAHGTPYGKVWKYVVGPDGAERVGEAVLGMFPATMGVTPDGQFLFVTNFNLHGDPEPSTVSVVYTPTMTEVAQPTTCVMPHGSRVNVGGTKQYSVCMHSEQLVEIDTRSFEVTARFGTVPGHEGPLALDDTGTEMHGSASAVCSPTWVEPGQGARADRYVYVACNKNAEILEVDVDAWSVTRRFPTGKAPYNLELTPDGRLLLVTLKGEQALAVIDLDNGEELARVRASQPITHGVVVAPDGRYAFVSNEAVGSTPGTVDVIDLDGFERIASVEVGYQPGGIDLLRVSP